MMINDFTQFDETVKGTPSSDVLALLNRSNRAIYRCVFF